MQRNRIQFQDGLTLDEFFAQYGTDELCKDAFENHAGQMALSAPNANLPSITS